jgi:replicative DNA helicase
MIFTDSLHSLEAEQNVLGFFFNRYIEEDKRKQILQLVQPEHFTDSRARVLYSMLKRFGVFDRIVLWDKIKSLEQVKDVDLKWEDLEDIHDFSKGEEIDSYVEILIDRYQKREMHAFGSQIQEAMETGEDQYEMALKAQSLLTKIRSNVNIETNIELLEKVLTENPGDIISTGYKAIDAYIGGFARGMIISIAGDSGHLKTTLALDQSFKLAEANPTLKIAIFSKEMTSESLVKKQISRICGIPISKIFSQDYDKDLVRRKMMEVPAWRENRIRIINPNSFSGVGDIARIQMTHRFDIWFLDFIQLLEFAKHAASSSDYNVQIGQNMRNLQSLALATGSVGIVLSQVKKGIEYRKIKMPTISDLEWSGLIKQLSSYIFFSYYPGKYYGFDVMPDNYHYLIAEKTRFSETFTYPMQVNPALGIFTEIEDIKERQARVRLLRDLTEDQTVIKYKGGSNVSKPGSFSSGDSSLW